MTEVQNGQTPETFVMPSRLRIVQRLGQISTNESLKDHLFPVIASYEGEEMTAEGLVDMLSDQITSYADEHAVGISAPFIQKIPSFINALVEPGLVQDRSLIYFHETVRGLKEESDIREQEILFRYKRKDLPRRMKKDRNRRNKRPRQN